MISQIKESDEFKSFVSSLSAGGDDVEIGSAYEYQLPDTQSYYIVISIIISEDTKIDVWFMMDESDEIVDVEMNMNKFVGLRESIQVEEDIQEKKSVREKIEEAKSTAN